MGRIADVQQAFEQRLSSLVSAGFNTANITYENIPYIPTKGTPWIRSTLLPADSSRLNLAGAQTNVGIYQIDIYIELEKGNAALLILMDDLYDHFDGQDLTVGTTQIFLKTISRTPAVREDSWLRGSLEIEYHSYST